MIERLFIKDCLSFEKIDLNLKPGLIVFTGASGVGKTVLMNSILALTGQAEAEAKNSELTIKFPFDLDNYNTNEEYSVIQQNKKEKTRFFLNELTISRKKLSDISTKYIDFMNVKDLSIFENHNMLKLLDSIVVEKLNTHDNTLNSYKEKFVEYKKLNLELEEIRRDNHKVEELKGFLEFEISKISNISPTNDQELEELGKIKTQLNNKEKITLLMEQTESFFELQNTVSKLLGTLEEDSSEFEESMNNVYTIIQDAQTRFDDLEDIDIEETLTRIEDLHSLVKKYGSIEECLIQLSNKEKELEKYNNIEFEESNLLKNITELRETLNTLDDELFTARKKHIKELNSPFQEYCKMLFLNEVSINIEKTDDMTLLGGSNIIVTHNNTELSKVSTGELNRLKLATLVVKSKYNMEQNNGILILDEIDSGLSGKESESIGKLLHLLSKNYQILSITHQPQQTSFATQHFLVQKTDNISSIVELTNVEDRQSEIARMISGEDITDKAFDFANELIIMSGEYKEKVMF